MGQVGSNQLTEKRTWVIIANGKSNVNYHWCQFRPTRWTEHRCQWGEGKNAANKCRGRDRTRKASLMWCLTEARVITDMTGWKISGVQNIQSPSNTPLMTYVDRNTQTVYYRNRNEFYLSQTEVYNPEDSLSDNTEGLLPRSMVFSTVLCLFGTKNIKQVMGTFLQVFEKKLISTYTVSQHGLGSWEGSLIIKGGLALASQEGRHLSLFLTWTFFTSGQYAPFFND